MEDSKIPPLAGYKEALEILGWDEKNRSMIDTYRKRGKFPEPFQVLASGPIWTVKQIEEYRDTKRRTNVTSRSSE
jgi:hypothetical protein